ncbi:aspartic proteinase CDR1-like [Apium graveolens]|uniref:aspartic proteinase CDR1-like n=1 Tax=Apium graveolens TaxID=4045 RepID=UPI003D790ED3
MQSLLCILAIIFVNVQLIKGLTVELIHRHSPQSPFYNASATPEDLSIEAVSHSLARYRNYFNQNKLQSTVIPNGGNYLLKIAVGTPPVEQFAVLDTDACSALPTRKCGETNNQCLYDYQYGDKSYTDGELATDTFTFDGQTETEFPGTIFGCGHMNAGAFTHGSGVVGLGQGALSLNSQLSNTIHNKFSYCLVPRISGLNSKRKFGEDADTASAANAVSTPMLSHESNYYYLKLEAVTVGGNTIQNQITEGGNIIIDSGTTLNMLNPGLYSDLEEAVRAMVGLNSVQHPAQSYNLCYEMESLTKAFEGKCYLE